MKISIYVLMLASIVSGCKAQTTGANVVSVPLGTRTVFSGSPYTLVTPPLQNIGQTNHEVDIVGTGWTDSFVNFWQVDGSMQGSLDGVTWFNLGIPQLNFGLLNNTRIRIVASGAFPYLRFNGTITVSGEPSVVVKINYTGISIPVFDQNPSSAPFLGSQDNFQFSRFQNQAFGAAQQINLATCNTANAFPQLYGGIFSNETATATVFTMHSVGVTSAADQVFFSIAIPGNSTVVLPSWQRVIANGSGGGFTPGEFIRWQGKSSAATTLSVYPQVRCEPNN